MRQLQTAGTRAEASETFAYELSKRDLLVLSVVLAVPIPLFAVSGAAIPLPEIVQRVAASLVPGGDDSSTEETLAPWSHGSITLTPHEPTLPARAPRRTAAQAPAPVRAA
ncbi:MAG TPA: hypothetical protein VJ689_03780, partial [Gaiellaceae bacterium]|nr:hypothetical protein [Gaiellaceae bacterium]